MKTAKFHTFENHRTLAMLRAVAAGRAQLSCSSEPDLFVDGLPCSDQFAAHSLAHAGLIQPRYPAPVGQRVPAVLTELGREFVAEVPVAA